MPKKKMQAEGLPTTISNKDDKPTVSRRTSKKTVVMQEYGILLGEIKERIHVAQYAALKAVNKELISLYQKFPQRIRSK